MKLRTFNKVFRLCGKTRQDKARQLESANKRLRSTNKLLAWNVARLKGRLSAHTAIEAQETKT